MSKPILFAKFHPGQGGWGCVTVKGITDTNYNDNRAFHADGRRHVLQQCFGFDCMDGTKFFTTWQADWTPDCAEAVTHIAR